MIEDFFEHPFTLRYLRGGVTGPHIDAFADSLAEDGYTFGWTRGLLRGVAHLGHWLERRRIGVSDLNESVLVRFRAHLSRCRCVRRNEGLLWYCRSAPNRFLSWARATGVTSEVPPEDTIPPLIREFEGWMLRHRNVARSTLGNYRLQLRRFLDAACDDPRAYDATGVRAFILAQAQRSEPVLAKRAVTAVRMLLRFLSVEGRCRPELVDAVPTVAHWKHGALPRYLSREVVEQIVASCDTTTRTGRRDHAALLLLATLGLRAGDVAALRLSHIDWSGGTLTVFGKGRREEHLPLPQDVGDAILLWVNDRRPSRMDDHVFLGVRAPWKPINRTSIGRIVADAAQRFAARAGVTMPRVGAHVLRHSVATALLREGTSLPAIGALLRHRSLETTTIYAKVDVNLLSPIARPWPEEPSPC